MTQKYEYIGSESTKIDIQDMTAAIHRIEARAAREQRPFTTEESDLRAELAETIMAATKHLPEKALTVPGNGSLIGGSHTTHNSGQPYALRGPGQSKKYGDMFGSDGLRWTDKNSTYFQALFSGRFHPELKNSTMTESVPSDGGFLVPTEYSKQIHNVALENEIVMPRCLVQPMNSNELTIPAMAISSHASSLMGGFTASFTAEAGTINEHNPKVRSMSLNAKKLTGLIRLSNELVADIPGGEGQIINLCGKGLGWYRDQAFLTGSGAGEPLGLLNANCLISVPKETGQKKNTIVFENLTNMMARMYAGSFANSIWVCDQSTIPQLLSLSIAIGTGGSFIPVMSESNGVFKILTRPVLFTEKTGKTLGNMGDVSLIDFSQYIVGLRSEIRFDTSIHVGFSTDELLARIISRFDGQPLWDSALTLADGTTTVSPFVALADRLI